MAGMNLRRALIALVVPILLLAGCGDNSDAESASDPTPTESAVTETTKSADRLPDCADVWQDGETMPAGYRGCLDGDTKVARESRYCEFGKPLLTYADRFYAVPRGTIHEVRGSLEKDRGYRRALASCTA